MICPDNEEIKEGGEDLELQRTYSERKANVMWRSCCVELNRDFTIFFTKYIMLLGLMVFFSYSLHESETCEDKNLFQSLLMLVLGISVPNPKLR